MLESIQNAFSLFQPYEWALLTAYAVIFLLRVVYLLLFTGKVAFMKRPLNGEKVSLSLILTVKNEEENLRRILPELLSVNNADFEIVAVDDFSQDNSLTYLLAQKDKDQELRVSSLNEEMRHSVKMAQNIALKASRHDWVMVIPPSLTFNANWLAEISTIPFSPKGVVVNYSNIKSNGKFLNTLYRVEFFMQLLKSFGFILNGLPYVVTEENVAFSKNLYFESGGYRGKISEPFANLELVINSSVSKKSIWLLLSDETKVLKNEDITKNRFFELLEKEKRLRTYLSARKRFWLIASDWSNIVFVLLTIPVLVYFSGFRAVIIILLGAYTAGFLFIIRKILFRLNERKLLLPSLLFALILPCFKLLLKANSNFYRRRRWKGKK